MKRKQEPGIRPSPPLIRQKALEIATQVCKEDRKEFHYYSKIPKNCTIYAIIPDELCWYVSDAWDDALHMLRSSRVIVISRMTGKVFYYGSAGDEG
jgi:hypothetical protein